MRLIHKIMLLLPIFIIWFELFCVLFFVKTKFYINNFDLIDKIDSFLVFLCGSHFIFFYFLYTKISKTYLYCIYSIILLNFLYLYLTVNQYYFLYYTILLIFILSTLWKKKN